MTRKWRFLIGYAVIFLALATYFFVFEVHKKRKETEAKESERRVFSLNVEDIREITIAKETEKILLVRENDRWRIVSPIETETDNPSVLGFVNTISDLRVKKWIGRERDLTPFGLKAPPITISVKKSSNDLYRLAIGGKTPTEDGIYAMAFLNDAPLGKEPIFVIDAGLWGVLNKGLYELRRKELTAFEAPQVEKIKIRWHGEKERALTITRDAEGWKLSDHPNIKVKKSRVDHIVDQIKWLRAQRFISNSKVDVTSFSLSNPLVDLDLTLYNRDPLKIQLGEHKDQKGSDGVQKIPSIEALSSDLPFVTLVDRYILNELPKKPDDLQDRSLMGWKEEEIDKIVWRRSGDILELVRDEGKDSEWKFRKNQEKGYSKLKEGWKVRSALWAASDIEYETMKEPVKSLPEKISNSVQFYGRDGKLLTEWNWWQEISSDPKDSLTLWVKTSDGDEIQVFTVPSSKFKNFVDRLKVFETKPDKKS
ncbi:MAG: DUF4340 domain-containing protein [Syntrophobacterales bacterium]|nr:DUF4340 domain-containing protein [Syntrophobacterales bacterium]